MVTTVPSSLWEAELSPPYCGGLYVDESTEILFVHALQFAGKDEMLLTEVYFGVRTKGPKCNLPLLRGCLTKDAKDSAWSGIYRPVTPDLNSPPLKIQLKTATLLFLSDDDGRKYVHLDGHVSQGYGNKRWYLRGLLAGTAVRESIADPTDW